MKEALVIGNRYFKWCLAYLVQYDSKKKKNPDIFNYFLNGNHIAPPAKCSPKFNSTDRQPCEPLAAEPGMVGRQSPLPCTHVGRENAALKKN